MIDHKTFANKIREAVFDITSRIDEIDEYKRGKIAGLIKAILIIEELEEEPCPIIEK